MYVCKPEHFKCQNLLLQVLMKYFHAFFYSHSTAGWKNAHKLYFSGWHYLKANKDINNEKHLVHMLILIKKNIYKKISQIYDAVS